ncbi:MAG: hypothetical protein RR539_07050 [Clostridium sp.]|uniref:hypothetical protein n=1 Tax=Clostridium sp. TaxID=1506 RepID=UPI002FCA8AF6
MGIIEEFIGVWKESNQGKSLSIIKEGEILRCLWTEVKGELEYKRSGIGILINNKLYVSRFSESASKVGIGIYKSIGDGRSNSALWASTQSLNTMGSGIAIRENISDGYEGKYKVRYFINGMESPTYDLSIVYIESEIHSLQWSIDEKVKLHGIGVLDDDCMALAWGEVDFNYEVCILIIGKDKKLNCKFASLGECIESEIYY